MFNFAPKTKRAFSGFMLVVQLFVFGVSSVGFPTEVRAVGGVGDTSITIGDLPQMALNVLMNALKQVGAALQLTAVEVASYLGQKVAHDAAVHLVAGASGQKPLFNAKDASEYVLDLGKDVAAQTLSSFVDNLAHIDICTFDPRTSLNLALGFAQTAGPIGRKCDFKALSNRFNKVKDEVASFAADPAKGFAAQMSVKFSPGNSTLDGFTEGLFGSINETQKKVAAMKDADLLERIGDVKGVKDPVTKKVKTPKEIVAAKSNDDLVQKPARDKESAMNAALNATGEEVVKIIGLTAKTFVATLLGEATKKIFAGLAPTPAADLANPFAPSSTGVAEANQALRSLLAVEPASVAQYDQVGQFSACPQGSGIHRNPDNCVINQQFAAAIRRGTTTTAVTIREALEQGSLQGDFPFIGPNDARNQDPNCYLQGYCYSNLVKLRRARIISIGWEMAAIVAEHERQGTTLKEVVDSFDGNNLQSFKHLIDPNWILKYPATQCRQMVNGAVLLSDRTPDRQQVCVDTPSCIQEDGKGNCLGAYGYCTKEKNVWRFDGDACPKEMSSCLAFTRPDNTKAAYLTNTLDAGLCNSSTAGCRNYLWNAAPTPTSLTGAPVAYIMNPAGTGSQFKVASDDPYVAANPTPYTTFSVGDLVEIGVAGAKKNVTVTNIQKQGTDINMTVSEAVTWGSALADHRIVKMQVTGSSIYLNKSAGVCNGSDKGCTELVDLTTKNSPANMFKNPSFEIDENADTRADGWNGTNVVAAVHAFTGGNGLVLASGQSVSQYVVLQPNVYYTVSVAAKTLISGTKTNVDFGVEFTDAAGLPLVAGSAPSPAAREVMDSYARYSSTFATPSGANPVAAKISIKKNAPFVGSSPSIAIDDVQLEYGETMTAYHEQYPYDAQKLTMKIPPAYLGCTGAATDNAECRNYAGVCAQSDVGCERYTPTNGDPAVNGALSALDLCPAACVGYDTFKQLGYSDPTLYGAGFEQEKFPVFFSPTFPGARSCSIASAGCDEFTNMQAAATGGEARQYYSKLRKCQVASGNTDTATYYTWEGSDTAGLQLKTWKLKKSNVDAGPCTYAVWAGGNGTISSYQCNDSAVDSSGNQLGMYDGIVATKQPYCKSHADVALNPDCREFYDEAGVTHYRLLSHTIVSADSCTQLRKTTVAAAPAGQDDCLATGGQWNAGASQCVYFALPNESLSCGQAEVGCRAYRGNAGGNTRQVFSETFETIVPSAGNVIPNYTGLYSTESLAANGHSIASQPAGVVIPLGTSINTASTYQMSLWAKSSVSSGSTLNWQLTLYKDVGGVDTVFGSFPTASEVIGPVMNDWVRLVTNPLIIPSLSATVKKATLTITASSGSSTFYVDNIEIREVQSTVAFIKNSWTVPAACDQTLEGASSPQEMLGCREYADRMSRRVTARSFTRLCGDNAVGCKAFADTQNSVSPNSQIYGARCYAAASVPVTTTTACNVTKADGTALNAVCQVLPGQTFCRFNTNEVIRLADLPATPAINTAYKASDTIVVAPDTVKYLLDDPSKRCAAEVKGCYEFGAAQYSQDKKVIVGVGKKTLLNLPDQYTSTLCGQEQNFCDAFAADDGSIRYFKDPEGKINGAPTVPGKICEYRDDVVVNGNHFAGWFKKGTDNACDETFVVGGGFNGVRKNADPNYDSWAAACAPALSKCTEFRDPTDRSDEAPLGKSYFFMKNDRVLQNTCNQVSRREGCALFEDTTNPTKYWNAEATYAASDAQSGALANAVACENDSSNQACKNRCRLGFSDLQGNPEPTRLVTSTLCVRDEDCSGLKIPGKRVTDARCVDIVSNNGAEAVGSTFESARDENLATRAKPLNNANLILKVRRDRECGEWLSCTTSSPVYDANKQETKEVCNEVRTCNRVVETNGGGTICSSFIDTPREALTRGAYQDRDISWKAGDISGYSIPGMVPPDRIGQVNVAGKCVGGGSPDRACVSSADCPGGACMPNQDDPDLRLAHKIGTSICMNKANGSLCKMGYCKNNPTLTCTTEAGLSGQECGVGVCSMDNTKDGRCYDNTCVQLVGNAAEIDNPKLEEFDIVTRQPEMQSCRAYPETDGPVPASAVEEWKKNALIGDTYTLTSAETVSSETVQWSPLRKNPQYSGANVCSFAKTANGQSFRTCECRYSKATYGGTSLVKYYPQGTRSRIKPNVCAGGKYDGAACIPAGSGADDPCGPEGSCVALQKIDNASGEMGYCLQRDLSVNVNGNNGGQACAVWLPVDALPGSVDMYNQDENAGFVPPEDDLYYCAASPGRSTPDGKATQQPYVNTFVNEANTGFVCSKGVNPCDAPPPPNVPMSKAVCESRATDLLGMPACVWKDNKCQTVVIPIPKPPGIDAFMPGCLPATGLIDKNGNEIDGDGQPGNDALDSDDRRKFLDPSNACSVSCGLSDPVTKVICVRSRMPTLGNPFPIEIYEPNAQNNCDNNSLERVQVPVSPPLPSCAAKVTNCCLPSVGNLDFIKGMITQVTNLNPSSYKVCTADWQSVPICEGAPNVSISVDSCLEIDKLIVMAAKVALASLAVAGFAGANLLFGGGIAFVIAGYISAVIAYYAGGIITALAAKCGELMLYGVCDLNPSPNKFMFTTLSPLAELAGIFPQPTQGSSSVRISPRLPAFPTFPSSVSDIPNALANAFPLLANLPKNLRKDEIAAVKVTVSGSLDDETRAVPRQFFLLPPNFEASFWWNGGSKEDTNATENDKATFTDSYSSKCGDEGISCPNAGDKRTCEDYFKTGTDCAMLVREIKEDNSGVENCAAIKARFGWCKKDSVANPNDPAQDKKGISCSVNAECGAGYSCVDRDIFQGFRSGMCVRSNVKGGTLPVKVEVLLRESCSVLTQTAKTSETSIVAQSSAYTDRVWDGKIPTQQFSIPQATPNATVYKLLGDGKTNAASDPYYPFGRTAFRGSDLSSPMPLYSKPQSGQSPSQPYTYFANASETDPPLKVKVVPGLPTGGSTFSCPQNNSNTNSIPSVPTQMGFMQVVRLFQGFIMNQIPVLRGKGQGSFGYCSNNAALCCFKTDANGNPSSSGTYKGLCGEISLPIIGSFQLSPSLRPEKACGATPTDLDGNPVAILCQPATSFRLSDITTAFTAQSPSESCLNVSPRPSVATADLAKNVLSQIYARSYGTFAWRGPQADTERWRFAAVTGFCNNNPAIECTPGTGAQGDGKCRALVDQYGRNINSLKSPTSDTANIKCVASTSVGWDVRNPDLQTLGATPLDKSAHEPYIYPIKQSSCRPTDGKCQMDLALRNSITVNDKNDGVVTGAGTMKATVKFYFETDKNHMPGKRIVVDWGDRSDTTDLSINYGLYKNRIGLRTGSTGTCDATTLKCSNTGAACTVANQAVDCKDGEAGKLGCDADQTYCSNDAKKQCTKDADCGTGTCSVNSGFGRSSRACENAYIAFSHTYTCDDTTYSLGADNARKASPVSVGKCDGAGGGTNGMCRVDADCAANVKCVATGLTFADEIAQKCIFKPRVMVLDNWGWCNGVCKNDTQIQSDICYSGTKQDGTTLVQDCDPSIDDPDNYPFPSINPWAKFNGTIEVRR